MLLEGKNIRYIFCIIVIKVIKAIIIKLHEKIKGEKGGCANGI